MDYDMMKYFFQKHDSFRNYGTLAEVLKELESENTNLYYAYKDYMQGLKRVQALLEIES